MQAPGRDSAATTLPASEENVARQDDSRETAMPAPSDEVQVARQEPAVTDADIVPLPIPAPARDRDNIARQDDERDTVPSAASNNEQTLRKRKDRKTAERTDRRLEYDTRYRLRQVPATNLYGNRGIVIVQPRYIRAGAPELGRRETLFTDIWNERPRR